MSFVPRINPRAPRTSVAGKPKARRVFFEALESRLAMAGLGLGIHVLEDNAGSPGAEKLDALQVGETFWIEVRAEDLRAETSASAPGVIGLPLNLSWDVSKLKLLNPPTSFSPDAIAPAELITDDFKILHTVDAYDPTAVSPNPNIDNLQGGSLPNAGDPSIFGLAIGNQDNPGFFSRLRFQALETANDTAFTMELSGRAGVDFADAASLDNVDILGSQFIQDRVDVPQPTTTTNQIGVTEFLDIVAAEGGTISLSGYVFADTDLNGQLNKDADGAPTEYTLPGVQISLFRSGETTAVATTTTGPDGWYHFEDLEAGTYRIVETQPAQFVDSFNELGTIVASAAGGGIDPPNLAARRGTVGTNEFSNIQLRGGEHGIEYNFGENVIPTKNLFRARAVPREALARQLGLTTRIIAGTTAADNIAIQIQPTNVVVTVNSSAPQTIARSALQVLLLNDLTVADTVTITGTNEAEVARFAPQLVSERIGTDYDGTNFGLLAVGGPLVTITAGSGGDDQVVFRDTRQTSDTFVAGSNTATLSNIAGRLDRAINFDKVRALTQEDSTGSEDDTSSTTSTTDFVLELVGDWRSI